MAEKRKRGQNFSLEEKDELVKILLAYKDTILNKKTDGTTNEAKNAAWISATNTFNSTATVYRSKESLMKQWEKLKSESKLYYNNNRRSCTETGGGPSIVKIDPVLEQVCAILGRGCTGILGVLDCDAEENNVANYPKVVCIDVPAVQKEIEESEEVIEIPPEEPEHIADCTHKEDKENDRTTVEINNTPLWSRRRPQLNQRNERTEAVSTLCASFQEVNKNKIHIEEMKLQLLQNENNFKNELYQLQLQAAKKEVEIKTEILKQIKGGSLGLQSLFGVPERKE